MTPPGISLIMPVYNARPYLREAIASVLNQTLRPKQIIVVDDGSTDGSLEISRSYGDAITLIAQANTGTAGARNRGIAEANQPMIAFLDNDDRFAPHKLQRQMQVMIQRPDAMLCLCRVKAFWSPEVPATHRRPVDLSPQFREGQPGSWLARREMFNLVGGFSADPECYFIEGSELYSRIESAGCTIAPIDDSLLERRLSESNKTANYKGHIGGIMTLMKRRLNLRKRAI